MAHPCPECDQACYCDGEDTWWDEAPDDCSHECTDWDNMFPESDEEY